MSSVYYVLFGLCNEKGFYYIPRMFDKFDIWEKWQFSGSDETGL